MHRDHKKERGKLLVDARMWTKHGTGISQYISSLSHYFWDMAKRDEVELLYLMSDPSVELPPEVQRRDTDIPIYSWREQVLLPRVISGTQADICFFPNFNLPALTRKPYVVTIHDMTILEHPGRKYANPLYMQAYKALVKHGTRHAQSVLTVSHATDRALKSFVSGVETSMIHLGSNRMVITEEEWEDAPEEEYAIIIGVWRSHKNLPFCVRAWERYRKEGGTMKLVITGNPDPHYPDIIRIREGSPYAKDLIFSGYLSEEALMAALRGARVLCMPSLSEGFGLPVVEALRLGTPVICSNTTSLPEVAGEVGWLRDPNDEKAWSEALQAMENLDLEDYTTLQEKGKAWSEKFLWKETAKKTWDILLKTLSSSKK